MKYKIAIVGTREAVAGFSLLGMDIVSVGTPEEAVEAIFALKRKTQEEKGVQRNTYGIVFVTEDLLTNISVEDERKLAKGALPAIVPLPSHKGSTGAGLLRLRRIVERAIGSDILT
ncbi:MAG: V-type ATP synthase subunit F [Candidatus Peribacteraceae bacterium]